MSSSKKILMMIAVLAACVFSTVLTAQEATDAGGQPAAEAAATTPPAAKDVSLLDLIVVGGWAMWPLGLCSFGLIALVAFNFIQVNQKKMMPPETIARIRAAAKEQDLAGVWQAANGTPSLFTNALVAGLRHIDTEDPAGSKGKVEEAVAEAMGREESLVGFWVNFLSLLAGVSPMIGLLGTVSGMIGAFQKIGQGGMGKPELLANNIGEALITTAAGLIIAIPAMFFFFLFKNILNRIILRAEDQFTATLDDLTGTGLHLDEAPAAE